MKGQGMLISALIFALVIAVFAVINVDSVQVNFLFATTTTPLILVILVSTLLGGLIVGLFGMFRIYRLQKTVKGLEKRVVELSGEDSIISEQTIEKTAPHMEMGEADAAESTQK